MKEKLHIVARHKDKQEYKDLFYFSIKQAKFYNPNFVDFRIVGNGEEINDKVVFNKNKLVLLSKLHKDLKNIYVEHGVDDKALKLRIQRRLLESMLQDNGVDELIEKYKKELEKFECV